MFIVSYAYYDEHCNLAVFETREEAQALAERLGGTKAGVAVEEIGQPTSFSFEFSWHNDIANPKITGVNKCFDEKESIITSEYGSYGFVVASSYTEAIGKIKSSVQRAKELTDS